MFQRAIAIGAEAVAEVTGRRMLTVHKFGGSSVGSASAIDTALGQIFRRAEQGESNVVVCSAVYGVTDKLVAGTEAALRGDSEAVAKARSVLFDRHMSLAVELSSDGNVDSYCRALESSLSNIFDVNIALLDGKEEQFAKAQRCDDDDVAQMGEERREYNDDGDVRLRHAQAELHSLGERLSVDLVARYADQCIRGGEKEAPANVRGGAAPLSAENLITVASHDDTDPLYERTQKQVRSRIDPLLGAAQLPIVTGFICSTVDGHTATLGRGGSDLTASTLASALDADRLVLWKVEALKGADGFMLGWHELDEQERWAGILSAPPPLVGDALSRTIGEISYNVAHEFSSLGRKVLHPATMQPVRQKDIPVEIYNLAIESRRAGTEASSAAYRTRISPRTPSAFSKSGVTGIASLPLAQYAQLHSNSRLIDALPLNAERSTVVALVGDDVAQSNTATQGLAVLSSSGVPALCASRLHESDDSIAFIVADDMHEQAAQVLHTHFCSPNSA
jgi:aspartokinase